MRRLCYVIRMTPKQVLKLVKDQGIEFIDCRFMDFPGLWQHNTYPAAALTERSFEVGFGFDGSAVRGWQRVNESDMLLVPVADTARVDPFFEHPTLSIICDVKDPITKKGYSRDPRSIARKASAYLAKSGVADTAYFGPEMEFFVFDSVSYDQQINSASYNVDSVEGVWNRGKPDPTNLGNQVRLKEGYFPMPPMDTGQNLRSEMVDVLMKMGVAVASHHHEVATCQHELGLVFGGLVQQCSPEPGRRKLGHPWPRTCAPCSRFWLCCSARAEWGFSEPRAKATSASASRCFRARSGRGST